MASSRPATSLPSSLLGRTALGVGALAAVVATQTACSPARLCPGDDADIERPEGWTVESHCPDVTPRYDLVFDDSVIQRFDIVVSQADHEAAELDLDDKYTGGSPSADLDGLPSPIWVPATVQHRGLTWTEVAMRWKGHSSLKAAWQSGVRKLSFRLNFDAYEDVDPSVSNQRMFGFRKLTFSSAFNDPSLLRDKISSDIFRDAGVAAAHTAFAAVTLDWGEGPTYLGLYAIVEDPSDQMLSTELGDGSGNLYKPWGDAARWLSLDDIEPLEVAAHFEKSTNDDSSDWADVLAAIAALHADRTDAALWRAGLEVHFDVASFVRTLAVNQVIMNWDSYGCMHHNYYVYANPLDGGRFVWMPWDLNESMIDREQSGCPEPGSVLLDEILSADLDDPDAAIDGNWPLIRFVLGDETYHELYLTELRAALDGAFAEAAVQQRMQECHDLIAPYVVGPAQVETYPYTNTTSEGFTTSLTTGTDALLPHVTARHEAVEAALGL